MVLYASKVLWHAYYGTPTHIITDTSSDLI